MKGKCYGHAIKSNSLSITVLQSSTLGKRKGRQSKKQKQDHCMDWTILDKLRHWYSTEDVGHVLSCSVTLPIRSGHGTDDNDDTTIVQ